MSGPWKDYQPASQTTSATMPWEDYKPQAATQSKTDAFDTVSDQALQGATFGLGNRAQAGLAALVASGINNKPISENYETARNVGTQRLGQEYQEHPVLAIGSNIGGALATGGLGADTAAGSALANSLRTGSLPLRMLKGAGVGAASGAAYGAGSSPYDQSLEGAKQGALTGALTGGAIPAAGAALSDVGQTAKNIGAGLFAKSPEAVQKIAEGAKATAGGVYDQMRQIGATFNPQSTQGLISDMGNALQKRAFIPENNPQTTNIVNTIKERAGNGTLSLGDLDQYRSQLGKIPYGQDTISAGDVRKAIDNFVNNAGQKDLATGTPQAFDLLNQGRKQYQQASKFEDISDILTKSSGDPNQLKAGLKRFANNPDNTAGWNDVEKSALKNAYQYGMTDGLLKMFGKFGVDLGKPNTMGNAIGPLVGFGVTHTPLTPVLGTAARIGQGLSARGSTQNLLNTLQNGGGNAISKAPVSGLFSAPAAGIAAESKGSIPQGIPQEIPQVQPQIQAPQSNAQPDLMGKMAQAESNGNPQAKNPNSSASGLLQFTRDTWAQMVGKYGKSTGITLQDKDNPEAQKIMGQLYAQDNAKYLNSKLDRQPTNGEIYMAHFLGPQGAVKLIQAQGTGKQAIMLFPRSNVDANRQIFFNKGQPRTVEDVYALLERKVS